MRRHEIKGTITVAETREVSLEEAKELLRKKWKELQAEDGFVPQYNPGDFVTIDNGAFALVTESEESEGSTPSVIYFDPDTGRIEGPSYGWDVIGTEK